MEDSAIARRRFIRPQENSRKSPRINDRIRAKTVRLIDQDENMIGLVPLTDAVERARSADLDLVEVSPGSDPPVCRILDFGKYKYELSKKDRANRAKTKVVETKEVRLGRSMKIDPHDIQIRLNQARKFLFDGHKVLIVQNFRGREMMPQRSRTSTHARNYRDPFRHRESRACPSHGWKTSNNGTCMV